MKLGVASGMEDAVAEGEKRRIKRIPVAVDDACPLVRPNQMAVVEVRPRVAVDLVGVVVGVPKGSKSRNQTIKRPEAAQPVRQRGRLRRVQGHEAGRSSEDLSTIIAEQSLRTDACLCREPPSSRTRIILH